MSFKVGAGESIAIVGASGSGKSTLLGLLAGLDRPSSGSVLIRGTDIFLLDEDQRAALRGETIGFVFQSFQLLPALNALENVMLPLELAGAPAAQATAHEWLERVGLSDRLNHYPKHLSGGEQQRVALARAFAPAPALLLADEPTGNLDAATGKAIIDLLFALNVERARRWSWSPTTRRLRAAATGSSGCPGKTPGRGAGLASRLSPVSPVRQHGGPYAGNGSAD